MHQIHSHYTHHYMRETYYTLNIRRALLDEAKGPSSPTSWISQWSTRCLWERTRQRCFLKKKNCEQLWSELLLHSISLARCLKERKRLFLLQTSSAGRSRAEHGPQACRSREGLHRISSWLGAHHCHPHSQMGWLVGCHFSQHQGWYLG